MFKEPVELGLGVLKRLALALELVLQGPLDDVAGHSLSVVVC